MAKRREKWIQKALGPKATRYKRRGALHRMLGVPKGEKIPVAKLRWAAAQGGVLGNRARFALTARGFKHHHGRKRRRSA
jgi:hypothetical protein